MFFLLAAENILKRLEQWDQWLFIQVNSQQSNSLFDSVMPYLRSQYYWIPLYLFLMLFTTINYRIKGWWWVLFFLCTVSLTDITSSKIIKVLAERLRPCNDPSFADQVRLVINHCGSGFSFTSSHAANHMGMATFLFFTFQPVIRSWAWLSFAWAASVCYAQVYVGVHYPFDILGGALIGLFFGTLTGRFFNNRFGFANFD